ncbi:MAG TPA: pitrilysin family protein [Longimicrobiales bacterium]
MIAGELFELLPTHERRLANGLTVVVREDRSAPVVAIVTHVKAGYFNEPDPVVGISHVLEHMYFKGTERFGAGEIARATKAAGGFLNAGTIYDHTSYYTVLPSSALERGLEIQSDALCNAEIDGEELRRELEVIIQEARRKLDNPHAVAAESLYETMFDVHRIRRWRIGTEEALRRLTREDVWRYYRDLYRASNIVLVVAGDVDADEAFRLVERYYGDVPGGEPVKEFSPEEPERRGVRFREMVGDVVHTHLEWGWPTPGTLDPDTPVLDLLAVVLGQGRASRLYRGVREAGWVTSISASNYTPTEIGVFSVSAELEPADTADAVAAVWREIEAVRREGVAAEELERARNILEARLLRNLETVEGQANLLARWEAYGGWRLLERYARAIGEATRDDVVRVARDYLALDRSALLVYRPASAEVLGWGAADVEARAAAGAAEAPGRRDAAAAAAESAEASAAPRPGVARGRASAAGVEDGVYFYDLPNGVRVAVKPRPSSPLVSMGVFVRGGALRERPDVAGITGLMARASLKATRSRSARRIAEEAEALGGAISPAAGADLLEWSFTVPARRFAAAFALLADVVLRPIFPEAEVERERKVALSDLERVRDDMYRYPMRLFLQGAFGGHPYGLSLADAGAALRQVDRAALERWHRREVLEGRPWVLVVGGVDPDAAADVIAAEMEEVRARPEPAPSPRPTWPAGPRVEAEHRDKAQTALVLGFPGPDRNDPDRYALDVLSNAVGGLGGRMFEDLRSRRSLAYAVAAYPVARWLGGAFVVYIATAPEREDEARRGILEHLERLADEALAPEELERSKEYTIGSWKIRGQTNSAQLGDLAGALLLGHGLAEIRTFEERIREVTPVGIREAMRRYYDPNRLVEGIVRGKGGGAG